MGKKIEHSGIVRQIDGTNVKVEIVQMSACSSCHANGACSAADKDEKIIDAFNDNRELKIGDIVTITGENSTGLLAVLIAFVIPFILILLTLIISGKYTENEALSAIISLSVLIPYFIVVSMFNKKLKKKFTFYISEKV